MIELFWSFAPHLQEALLDCDIVHTDMLLPRAITGTKEGIFLDQDAWYKMKRFLNCLTMSIQ